MTFLLSLALLAAAPVAPTRSAPASITDGQLRGLTDDRNNTRAEALEAGVELGSRGTLEANSPLVWPFFIDDTTAPQITLPVAPFLDGTVAPYVNYQLRRRRFQFTGRYDGNVSARSFLFGVAPFAQHNLTAQADVGDPSREVAVSTTASVSGGTSDVADAALSLGTPAGLDQTLGLFSYLAVNLSTVSSRQFTRRTFGTSGAQVGWLGGGGSDQTPGLPLWQALGFPLADPQASVAPQMQPRVFVRGDHLLTRRLSVASETDVQAVWTLDARQFAATSSIVEANHRLTPIWSLSARAGALFGGQFQPHKGTDTWLTVFPIAQVAANYSTRSATSLGDSLTFAAGLTPLYDALLGGLTERLDVSATGQMRFGPRISVEASAQAASLVWVLGQDRAGVTLTTPTTPQVAPLSSWSPLQALPDPQSSHHVAAAVLSAVYVVVPGVSLRGGVTGSASGRWPYWPVGDNFALRGAVFVGLIARSTLLG